jgi:RNA polymerase primary sigma factor
MTRSWSQPAEPVENNTTESEPSRDGRRAECAKGTTPMLRLYLAEMGATPLLDEIEEVQLASQLRGARIAIAKLAQSLPESCRELVLAGDASGPKLGANWPLSDVENFLGKLVRHSAECPETAVATVLTEIRAHKRALDDARDGLILANLRLVVHIAKKYAKSGLPIMDLIQDGNLGLLRAVEKFEHERGHKFSTYAFWWIKQSVERGIAEKSRTIRIPVHVNEAMRRVGVASRDLGQSLGRQATPREIATQLRVPIDTVDQALSVVREPLPLEHNSGERGGYDLATSVPDVGSPSPLHAVSQREIEKRVDSALKGLNPREETIVRMRFGIGREVATTLEQIGGRLSLSRERVRQIEGLALAKIKASPLCRDLAELFGVGETRGVTGSATSRFAR